MSPRNGPEWAPTGNTPEARRQLAREIGLTYLLEDEPPTPDEYAGLGDER